MPELMKGLGVELPGKGMMQWQQFQRWGMHNLEHGSFQRKARTIAKLLTVGGVAIAGFAGTGALIKKLATRQAREPPQARRGGMSMSSSPHRR